MNKTYEEVKSTTQVELTEEEKWQVNDQLLTIETLVIEKMWGFNTRLCNTYSNKYEALADAIKLGKYAEAAEAIRHVRALISSL